MEWLKATWMGAPHWFWIGFLVTVIVNEIITHMKWTRAGSLFQGALKLVLKTPVIGKIIEAIPIVGDVLKKMSEPAVLPKDGPVKVIGVEPPPPIREGE
jgi:hypothetical protein